MSYDPRRDRLVLAVTRMVLFPNRFNMEKFCQQSLDTLGLARRVRELLSIHNIGQRLFAKYVLGLSQVMCFSQSVCYSSFYTCDILYFY